MSEYDALVAAILANPGDDTPRLVFADWLDENGEPGRAEFIRAQIGDRTEVRAAVCRDERSGIHWRFWLPGSSFGGHKWLFDENESLYAIVGKPLNLGDEVTIRRGFVDEIRCPLASFPEHAPALFQQHPITRVVLVDRTPYWNGAGYCWYDASRPPPHNNVPETANLPKSLFGAIAGAVAGRQRWKGFRNVTAADAALSTACVTYGRELAGLPELEPAQNDFGSS